MNGSAFVPQSTFIPRRVATKRALTARRPSAAWQTVATGVQSTDAMEFFRHREGKWSSWRVTHHLAFQRDESGESEIVMRVLEKEDEQIKRLCQDHDVDPEKAQGGCYVTWKATMAWDQEGENHEGSTVFALVPDDDDIRKGRILRDRGYAEIVPITGTYHLDENDDLCLETPYDGGAVEERFAFDGPDIVNRTSTVRRFGGFSTATFATEKRSGSLHSEPYGESEEDVFKLLDDIMLFSPGSAPEETSEDEANRQVSLANSYRSGPRRFATRNSAAPPSANSAFGSGFSAPPPVNSSEAPPSANSAFGTGFSSSASTRDEKSDGNGLQNGNGANEQKSVGNENKSSEISAEALEEARKQGIDLLKIPPSMRDDFVASFDKGK